MNQFRNYLLLVLLFITLITSAQIPEGVPHPKNNSPIDLSDPFDLIMFVVLPIAIIVLYIIWRKKKKK